jgi:hypothetical protein
VIKAKTAVFAWIKLENNINEGGNLISYIASLPRKGMFSFSLWVCLDGERISERIILFELVVENSERLVISREM